MTYPLDQVHSAGAEGSGPHTGGQEGGSGAEICRAAQDRHLGPSGLMVVYPTSPSPGQQGSGHELGCTAVARGRPIFRLHLPFQVQARGKSNTRFTRPLATAGMGSSVPAPTSMPTRPSVTATWRPSCAASKPQVGPVCWLHLPGPAHVCAGRCWCGREGPQPRLHRVCPPPAASHKGAVSAGHPHPRRYAFSQVPS